MCFVCFSVNVGHEFDLFYSSIFHVSGLIFDSDNGLFQDNLGRPVSEGQTILDFLKQR